MGMLSRAVLVLIVALLLSYIPVLIKPKLPTKGQGFAAPGWREVGDIFRQNLDAGLEKGATLAVYHKGELVVEFAGGYADDEAAWAIQKDTLVFVASTVKAVSATVIAMLVDKGLLSYDKPVAHYWPEFAQNGKDQITLKQLVSHQAGLAAVDVEFHATDFLNKPEEVADILAKQAPNWTPGSKHGYHGLTLVPYMDQLVKRVDPLHRDIGQFFDDEVARKFSIDFYYGLPLEETYRSARTYDYEPPSMDLLAASRYWEVVWTFFTQPKSLTYRSIVNPKGYDPGSANHPDFRNIPVNGYGTAIGLGRLMGILANAGMLEGKQLLSPSIIKQLNQPLVSGKDEVLRMNITYGLGFTLRESPTGGWMFGAPGAGGQMAYCDPENQLGWAYLTNHHSIYAIGDDPEYLAVEQAMYQALQKLDKKE